MLITFELAWICRFSLFSKAHLRLIMLVTFLCCYNKRLAHNVVAFFLLHSHDDLISREVHRFCGPNINIRISIFNLTKTSKKITKSQRGRCEKVERNIFIFSRFFARNVRNRKNNLIIIKIKKKTVRVICFDLMWWKCNLISCDRFWLSEAFHSLNNIKNQRRKKNYWARKFCIKSLRDSRASWAWEYSVSRVLLKLLNSLAQEAPAASSCLMARVDSETINLIMFTALISK